MANPNNCGRCDHKKHPDGGWCYMFKDEPAETCLRHTGLQRISVQDVRSLEERLLAGVRGTTK